jgi:oligopeptide transport system substrate-binding protein
MLRAAAVLAPVLALTLALGACSPSKPLRAPCAAGKLCLQFGNTAEPTSLDPPKTVGVWEDRILGEMLIGLTQNDPEGRPVPGMARSWETSPDGLTWTFHLRDAKWSDGVPVVADDFVFGAQRLMNPATASEYSYLDYVIKNAQAVNAGKLPASALGIKALDPKTVQITLEHPAPYLPELLKHQTMYRATPGPSRPTTWPTAPTSWPNGASVTTSASSATPPTLTRAGSATTRSASIPPPTRSPPSGGCAGASWT